MQRLRLRVWECLNQKVAILRTDSGHIVRQLADPADGGVKDPIVARGLMRKKGMAEMHNEYTTPKGPRQSLCIFDIKSRICGLVYNTNTTFILYIKYNKYTDNMIGDPYSEPNNDREAWAILTLECAKGKITGWRIGYGNAVKITRVAEQKVKDEKGVMKELLKEIRTCRKKGTLLITFHRHALTLLRTKLLILGIDASLRGLRNVCVEEIMSQYFNTKKIPVGDDVKHDPNALWAFFKKIGSLVPQRVLEGDLL